MQCISISFLPIFMFSLKNVYVSEPYTEKSVNKPLCQYSNVDWISHA